MKAFFIIVLSVVAAASCIDIVRPRTRLRPFADVLREQMYKADLLTYTDGLFGYTVAYPACFRPDRNAPSVMPASAMTAGPTSALSVT